MWCSVPKLQQLIHFGILEERTATPVMAQQWLDDGAKTFTEISQNRSPFMWISLHRSSSDYRFASIMLSTIAAKIEFSTPLPKDLCARWSESFLLVLGSVFILHDDLCE
jgi:hypothetical protein